MYQFTQSTIPSVALSSIDYVLYYIESISSSFSAFVSREHNLNMLDPETKLKYFDDAINDAVTDLGYTDISVHFKNISELGENYLGDVLKVNVTGVKNEETERLAFVVKAVPDDPIMRNKIKADEKFHNEVVVYNNILPVFEALQKKFKVQSPLVNCEVVKTVDEEYKEMLLMYDMTGPGFDFEQSRVGKVLDLEHARSVVKNIGKLQALSFATNKYSPGLLEKHLSPLSEMLADEPVKLIVKHGLKATIEVVEDPVAKEKLWDILASVVEYITKTLDHKNVEPYAVLVHGDMWSNNIMYKYEGDTVVDSIFLDWQIVRYHTPILDLLFFLFTSVDDGVRAANLQSLLDLYHSSLSEYLRELKCNPEELYPWNAFREQLKTFTKFALINILFMLPVFTGKPFDPSKIDFSDRKKLGGMPELTDLYKDRVNATLRDLTSVGLF